MKCNFRMIVFSLVLILTLIPVFIFAENQDSEYELNGYWEYWEVDQVDPGYDQKEIGNWVLCYRGQPAKRDGETQTASASLSVEATISGTIKLPINIIEANLGFNIGVGYQVGGYTTSGPLKKGEYVLGYAKPIVSVTKIVQRKYIHMDGQNIRTNETSNVFGNLPTAVTVKLEYYSESGAGFEPYKVEYYLIDMDTQILKLIKTEYLN